MAPKTFDASVSARTRAARLMRDTPELFAIFKKIGGLQDDLDAIVDSGEKAELLSQVRGAAQGEGVGATVTLLKDFARTQHEYVQLMAVLQAVRNDMENASSSEALKAAVDNVLANETPVVIRTVEKTGGEKQKVAVRTMSQEGIRAEIQKDAATLLEMKEVLKFMAKRGVNAARIKALKTDAEALAGKLASRTAAKGASKGATAELRQAVQEQKRVWAACYRILALVAQQDQRVKSLLAEAAD